MQPFSWMPNIWLCTRPCVSSCASQRGGQTLVLAFGERIVEKAQLLNAGVQVSPSQGRKFKRLLPVSIKDILMGAVNSPQGLRSLSASFTSLHLHMFQHFSKVHLLCYCPDRLNSSQWDPNNSRQGTKNITDCTGAFLSFLQPEIKKRNPSGNSPSRNPV